MLGGLCVVLVLLLAAWLDAQHDIVVLSAVKLTVPPQRPV